MDLDTATTAEVLRALEGKEISSVELLNAFHHRMVQMNPVVNAVVTHDLETALTEAAAADDERMSGEPLGPLHGLPMTIKDTWETAGMVTTAGSPDLADYVPDTDADVVRMLQRDGAIVWAKTNVPRYAMDHQTHNELFGTTNNPWDLGRTSGGSSGGAAAALSCGFTTAEVGSDIGGSIRQPAAFCGVYGLKTTHGLISSRGHIPGPPGSLRLPDLGVYGPMARSCGDLRVLLRTLVKSRSFRDAPNAYLSEPRRDTDINELRLGLWLDDAMAPIDRSMKSVIENMAAVLDAEGAAIDPTARPATSSDRFYDVYFQLLNAETMNMFSEEDFERRMTAAVADNDDGYTRMARASTMPHAEWIHLDEQRWQIEEDWYRLFESVDAVIAPVAPLTAFAHDNDDSYWRRTITVNGVAQPYSNMSFWPSVATLPLLPAVTIPIGYDDAGMPVGVQIIGNRWTELKLLDIAEEIASVIGQRFAAPTLVTDQRASTAGDPAS